MKYNRKSLLHAYMILTLYLVVSYWILNRYEIANPSNGSIIAITTNAFSYYDLRTVTYIYSAMYLLFINLVIQRSPHYILRLGNRNSIIVSYFRKILGTSFGFVTLHGSLGIILTILFFGIEKVLLNHFLLLSIIYASVLFLYFLIIALFLSVLEILFSVNISLILGLIIIIFCYFMNNKLWTPILDTRIFGFAYIDTGGLNIFDITRIYLRQIAVISMLLIVKSILIQRKDYFE
ncbi:WxPxxD family membrane protein [Peribacillus frigoritolerans]|uniref:WxPxxD family membrane protein n=1 Tax=Peribacillus frigoritolerans TaxID=450367 RepID=UPI0022806AA9|nr:WxPxxD family membrane protein [Peribacillus frigoritolerans]MCY8935672.1 WxPxxD family membrane protein [Peribacillus frigoritolerans]